MGKAGASFGIPYLFLDPEYLEHVGYLSFALVGIGFGALFVTWNIVSYMLHSHRFHFLASFEAPLAMFFINNSIIPIVFIAAYLGNIIVFQAQFEFQNWKDLVFEIVGFIAGFILVILVTSIYFQFTNRTALKVAQANKMSARRKKFFKRLSQNEEMDPNSQWEVDSFISSSLSIRYTRTVEHYEDQLMKLVFRQHHINSLFAQIATIMLLIGIGYFAENPFFQIPTAASIFFIASILVSLTGVFIYWTGGWGTTAIIVFIVVANQLTKYDLLGYQSRAHGLNYQTKPAEYNLENLRRLSADSTIKKDIRNFTGILNNWKRNNTSKYSTKKPKLVLINASGGGSRAAMFTMAVLQEADSVLNGTLMRRTFMMSGASGGTFGLSYFRELYYRKQLGTIINLSDKNYSFKIARDLLNPMGISIVSNDLFFPIHKFKLGQYTYFRDRGYFFEKYLSENTDSSFNRRLIEYRKPEYAATIPLIIEHTLIINDSRRFYISPQPVSFLMRSSSEKSKNLDLSIDAIDFGAMFKEQDGYNLLFASAARMNATFPYILPNPVLPTEPPTYVMDGGAIDNFGAETTLRFLSTFKDWINENTSGVLILQIRDTQKEEEPEERTKSTFLENSIKPIGSMYSNLENIQDYVTDKDLTRLNDALNGKINVITFEYIPEKKTEKAALSLHLTFREKRDIIRALGRPNNTRSFELMRKMLTSDKVK